MPVRARRKDPLNRSSRSCLMGRIRAKGNGAENRMAYALKAIGLKFTRNDDRLPGKPDFVLWRERVVVFLDGDFWHGRHMKERGSIPTSNSEYWTRKLSRNIERDNEQTIALRAAGWGVVRVWESDFNRDPTACCARIAGAVKRRTQIRQWRKTRVARGGKP